MTHEETCCPPFTPEPWDEQEFVWNEKKFTKARVRSLFHIPLNFGGVSTSCAHGSNRRLLVSSRKTMGTRSSFVPIRSYFRGSGR